MPQIDLTQQHSNRFQLVRNPPAPAHCVVCGYVGPSDSEPEPRMFVDWGMNEDFYGAIVICTTCFTDAALIMGYVTPVIHDNIIGLYQDAVRQNTLLASDNEHLRNSIAVLSGAAPTLIVIDSSINSFDEESDEDGSDESETDDTESVPDESASVEGSDDSTGATGGVDYADIGL